MQEIEEFTDSFVEELRRRLDVGALVDEYFASDWLEHYRGHHAKDPTPLPIAPDLAASLDDQRLRSKAIADWNLLYLSLAYALGVAPLEPPDPDEKDEAANLLMQYPVEFLEALASAQYASLERRHRPLATAEEVDGYVAEVCKLAAALRPHLTAEVFASERLKNINVKMQADWPTRTWKDQTITEHPEGFSAVRDGLMFNLVEQEGRVRMLCLGQLEL